jgi:PAS domain S-box-containing protein
LGMMMALDDITQRKNAEHALQDAYEEKNTILESIGDAFFAVDKNWVVTYWNNQAEKVLMMAKNNILGHNLWEVFSDSINSDSYKNYHRAIKTNTVIHFEDHYEALGKWYEISAYPSDKGLSVYFKDISERKLSEIKLKELNENLLTQARKLEMSNTELEQFAYVASHDLQEPLRMVTSFLARLETKYADVIDENGKQYIYFATDGAKRMRQLILDLLAFSRVGRVDTAIEEVDVTRLLDEKLELYQGLITELKAEIRYGKLPVVRTDKTPLMQVFQNLVSNSLKYRRDGVPPVIEITCREKPTEFEFLVQDNGIGIDSEYFDKIFILFQRLHNKNEYSGTGMGLAITKKIVENMGGRIWVESEEGKGAKFYFTLPKSDHQKEEKRLRN